MGEKIVIYVAGNPDGYPLEYYDPAAECYQGVIPQLLRKFSAGSDYEVLYYSPDGGDQREHLAQNLQVDLLSGYREGEVLPDHREEVVIFSTVYEGQRQNYCLCLTQAAPPELKGDLEAFFQAVPQEEISGILMEQSASQPRDLTGFYLTIGGLALGAALLACALILAVRRYRKRLRNAERMVKTDEVTGLGNYDYLLHQYQKRINAHNRVLYSLVYFYVDLDSLRRSGGNGEADQFLNYCGRLLENCTAGADILARVSDRGFVLLKYSSNEDTLQEELRPLFEQVHGYSQTYGKSFEVNLSAGVCQLKQEDQNLKDLIFSAAQGAREAWRNKEDLVLCTSQMRQKLAEERNLQNSLDGALAQHEFELYLQFYVDAHNFQIMGGEALSRWKHPQKGVLSPDVFIPMLERTGVIYKLDYYCLEESCRFLDELMEKGIDRFFVSCNFSRDTFAAEDFVRRCKQIIEPHRFPRELLIFELTESVSEKHAAQIRQNMLALKDYGVRIALDDFGEGFSSFHDLQQYPVDGLKLDKGLVTSISTKPGMAILRAMVQVGHELGLTILAEGVESEEQVKALQAIYCDVIQGFRFHRPIPAQVAQEMILHRMSR